MARFPDLVAAELQRARAKHSAVGGSREVRIMCWASVLREELDEFWDECKRQECYNPRLLAELVQLAAMAQRAAENLDLVERGAA